MGNVEIPKWLKGLPLAPEFRPTDTEFADPIAYISKIEREASAFGICKIIPPIPKPSKRYVFSNLNKSLSKCPELGDDVNLSNVGSSLKTSVGVSADEGELRAVFTTRHQELGQSYKRTKAVVKENPQSCVLKQVWQSGEIYTLEQFESKSKAFARNMLSMIKEVNPLIIEALFWKTASEKPVYVEYANDVPGSGFAEPDGYLCRRRRKRASYQSYRRGRESSGCQERGFKSVNNSQSDEVKVASVRNDEITPKTKSDITSSTPISEETLRSSKRKSINASNDMEGTAGWKLSNSPWNLQVIARSPGSLTRFMPDDIPGVTSPMVYIGMLFSWFAWHVEDHELHSMNFLHTGSPKTWYAVPGDWAFAFEEAIRTEAYGGNADRLAALTLLGEKTTLLSPEMVVSSGIPCCRLVQNPGEFVVTFPRAYHVGFSHGFNCGEAANFGTPQWLNVAKEAAVRRAAMNYLPMLSHQQLLYLLTMSFVARVPRSLLPGARSSRLRDHQKEKRELSVKKAFIEDILKENNLLSALLAKNSTYRAVIWNPDLLPCASKESQMSGVTGTVVTMPRENESRTHSDHCNSSNENNLFQEMSLYMESLNDLYMDDDDLSSDFQVDSGTLACVACGILGFPFMSVVQPSETALSEILPEDCVLVQEGSTVVESESTNSISDLDSTVRGPVSDDPPVPSMSLPLKDLTVPKGWNPYSKSLRPRIFCLQHGVQIEELLRAKGGSNLLIICHSDYQKMKAHATVIAEEIGVPFNYFEASLDNASQEDLNLIDLAIDNESHIECGEDWTSKLGINLRYCVKIRKNSPSKQIQHALVLGGLFTDTSPSSEFLNIKWRSRRFRSRMKLNQPSRCEPCDNVHIMKDKVPGKKSDGVRFKNGEKLIQYTRRKFKVKKDSSSNASQECHGMHLKKEVSVASTELGKHTRIISATNSFNDGSVESRPAELDLSLIEMSENLHEVQVLEGTSNMSSNCAPSRVVNVPHTGTVVVESYVGQIENQHFGVSKKESNICNLAACGNSKLKPGIEVTAGNAENEDSYGTKCSSVSIATVDENMEDANVMKETCDMVSEVQFKVLDDKDYLVTEVSDITNTSSLHAVEKSCKETEVCDHMVLDKESQEGLKTTCRRNNHQCISHNDTVVSHFTSSMEESHKYQQEIFTSKDKLEQEVETSSGNKEEEVLPSNFRPISQPTAVAMDESFETPKELCDSLTGENGIQQAMEITNESKELPSCSRTQMELDQSTSNLVEESCEDSRETSAKGDLCTNSTEVAKVLQKIPTADKNNVQNVISNSVGHYHTSVLVENQCKDLRGICTFDDLSADENLDINIQEEIHLIDGVTRDTCEIIAVESHSSHNVQMNPSTPIQECSIIQEESCCRETVLKESEVCSSHEQGSMESTVINPVSTSGKIRKRKSELEQITENKLSCHGFIRSPCEGLRSRTSKNVVTNKFAEESPVTKRARKTAIAKKEIAKRPHKCDLEGCSMSFETKAELQLHKHNRCPYEGCRKKFSSHKYAIIHQRVHEDDRPLKCPWKGCSMSFKWAWARTEHIRVHTGEKPYQCKVEGCGLSFRFVSDFSRHRRKTGHYTNTPS